MTLAITDKQMKYTVGGTLLAGLPLYTLLSIGLDAFLPASLEIGEYFSNPAVPILAVNIYMLFWGLGQLVWGGVIERLGVKPVALIGIVLYTASSFVITLLEQGDAGEFILLRALQSLGGSGSYTAIFALIRMRFDGRDLNRSYSYLNGILGFIPVSAPLIGAYVLETSPWLYLFTLMFAMGLVSLIWVVLFIPSRDSGSSTTDRNENQGSLMSQYYTVMTNLNFRTYMMFALVGYMLFIYYLSVAPNYLIGRLGHSQIEFGQMFMIIAVIFMSVSFLAPKVSERFGVKNTIGIALVLCLIGGVMMLAFSQADQWYTYILSMSVIAVGNTLLCSCSPAKALDDFKQLAGVASGLYTAGTFGLSAVMATLLASFIDSAQLSTVAWVYILTSVIALIGFRYNKTIRQ